MAIFSLKSWVEEFEALKKLFNLLKSQKRPVLLLIIFFLFMISLGLSLLVFLDERHWAKLASVSSRNLVSNSGFEEDLSSSNSGWGTGSYEKKFEDENNIRLPAFWVSLKPSADIKAQRDYRTFVNGDVSLKIVNNHGQEDDVFGTISQKIKVKPQKKYLFSFAMKVAADSSENILNVSVYPDEWKKRINPKIKGRDVWSQTSEVINSGPYQNLDIRFIFEQKGIVWIDNVVFREVNGLFYLLRWGLPLIALGLGFLIVRLRNSKSIKKPAQISEFYIKGEKVLFEEIIRSFKFDIIKISAHTHTIGVSAEYKWLHVVYPGMRVTLQALKKITATNKDIEFDVITIQTKEGETKDIYFDISSFFNDPVLNAMSNEQHVLEKIRQLYE